MFMTPLASLPVIDELARRGFSGPLLGDLGDRGDVDAGRASRFAINISRDYFYPELHHQPKAKDLTG